MIKRILHTITVFAFFLNQISISSVYAMDPPDKSITAPRVHVPLPLPLSPSEKVEKNQYSALPHIFLHYLDNKSLETTAQVNKNWKALSDNARMTQYPHRPWFLTRRIFEKKLKETLSVEEDMLTPLLFSLRCAPFFEDIFLTSQRVRILPKDLLDPHEQMDFLSAPVEKRLRHPYLKTFNLVFTKLGALSSKNPALKKLRGEYERILNGLLEKKGGVFSDPQAVLRQTLGDIEYPSDEIIELVAQIENLALRGDIVDDIFPMEKTFRCYFDEVVQLWADAWHMPKPSKFFFARLESIIQMLNQRQENSQEYKSQISALLQIYEGFKQNLSQSPEVERISVLTHSRLKSDIFPHWLMNEEKVKEIFSIAPTGSLLLEEKLGSSWVKPYPNKNNPELYFKYCKFNNLMEHRRDSAFHPGMESGIYRLSQLLGGLGIVPSTFLILNKNVKVHDTSESAINRKRDLNRPENSPSERERLEKKFEDFFWETHAYGIQVTPAVHGRPLISCLEENPRLHLDSKSYSFHILLGFIARPADYKGDNLLVNKFHEIIGIDNDLAFASPIIKEVYGTFTEFKNILFCLPQMGDKVHSEAIKFFAALTPETVILEWLGALSHQNKRYEILLKTQEVSKDIAEKIHLPLKLHPQTVPQMLKDLHTLKRLLTKEDITHQELFSGLWPQVALYYETLVKNHGPLKAWELIYGGAAHQGNALSFEKVISKFDHLLDQGSLPRLGDYRKRTLSPEKAAEEILDQVGAKVSSLSPDELNVYAEKILKYFPKKVDKYFDKNTLLKVFGSHYPSDAVISFLIQRLGKDLTNENGETLLHLSVKYKHKDLLKKLLKQNIPYMIKDKFGFTPLDTALRGSHHKIVKILIDKGAGPYMNASIGLKYYKAHKETNQEIIEPLLTQHMEFAWLTALEEILPPRGYGLLIKGASSGPRVIPETIHQHLYSPKGMIKKNTTGRHCVSHVKVGPHTLYFKEYPEIPGFEEAVGSLGRLLFGDLTPYVELFEIYGKPVLVSFGIPGETFQEAMKRDPHQWDKLDHEQLVALTFLSYLTNPEDGKPDNLQLWNNKLYSIDNDHAFVQAVAKEEKKGFFQSLFQGPIVQVKTMLYSMEHMHKSIPEVVRQKLLNFDIGRSLNEWLIALKSKTQGYHLLFDDEKERMRLFDKENCYLGFPFDRQKIEPLYQKIILLKDLVYRNSKITLFEILQGLEKELGEHYNPTLTSEMVNNFKAKVGQFYEQYVPQEGTDTAFKKEFFKNLQILQQSKGLKLFEALPTENNLWKMYVRFLFVDGEFYLRNKGGSLTTLSTSKDLLLSQSLPWKEGLLSCLNRPGVDNIKAAQDALKALMERQVQIEGVPLHEIRDDKILEKKLKEVKFQNVGATQQLEIIKALRPRKLSRVSLTNSLVTDELVKNHLNFRYLKHLDLRGCQGITVELFPSLSQKAPLLEILNCADTKVTAIGTSSQPLEFKTLKLLSLDSCFSLTHFYLKAPLLKEVRLEGSTKLEVIRCKGALEKIALGEISFLSRDKLKNLVVDNPTLQQAGFGKRLVRGSFLKSMPNSFKTAAYSFLNQEVSEDEVWLMGALYSNMKSLDLSGYYGRKLDNAQIKKLIPVLQTMTQLTKLDLGNNQIRDEGTLAIAQTMTQLEELHLEWNQIGGKGVLAIAQTMTQLKELDLAYNQIGDPGALAIAQNMTQLEGLNLGSNKIGDPGILTIAQNVTQLKKLDLRNNQIGVRGAQAIVQNMSQLTGLNLRDNKIGEKGALAISKTMTKLTSLNLVNNQIGDAGTLAIAQTMTQLRELDLSVNAIGDTGAQAIAQFMTQLRELKLSVNAIGDAGAQAIAQTMTQLRELNLRGAKIGDPGALAIAQTMTQLRELDLAYNQIGDPGALAIAQTMTQLRELDLAYNQIGDSGALALAETMMQLRWLNLRSNKITNPILFWVFPRQRKTLMTAVFPSPVSTLVPPQQVPEKKDHAFEVTPPQATPVQSRAQLTEIQKLNLWGKEGK